MDLRKKVEIYGDSIMRGVILDKSNEKYYFNSEENFEEFQNKFPLDVINNSKFGCTIDKGYKMLERALKNGISTDMILLEYGGNDCDYNWTEISENPDAPHVPFTTLQNFTKIYKEMIEKIKSKGIRPAIMSIPPIDAEKYFKWFTRKGLNQENILKWLGDIQTIYRHQELYSLAATKIAYETGATFIDIRSAFLDKHNYKELLCDDGIHPNQKGHKIMAQTFSEYVSSQNLSVVFC